MLGRIVLVIISLSVIYAVYTYAADSTFNWSFEGKGNSLQLIDDENVDGDEFMILKMNGVAKYIKIEREDKSLDTYGGAYLVTNTNDSRKEDLSVELAVKSGFENMLVSMKSESFRRHFEVLPETCPPPANAFLMIIDNLTTKMYGYCLTPVASEN